MSISPKSCAHESQLIDMKGPADAGSAASPSMTDDINAGKSQKIPFSFLKSGVGKRNVSCNSPDALPMMMRPEVAPKSMAMRVFIFV